ncbi:hypothetical protein [Acinetobacter sp. YH12029]|uniref:hypothetical protein n=1 Tax=Acinetobacter sp. YH12029 TaxID=2601044 RepID=UPI0015D35089|nr:hypothetical protein [Acinetobacter sp. YH12029]
MDQFMLCPLQEGYVFTPGNNVREQKTEGGMPRQVIKFVGAIHTVSAAVYLKDPQARQYFWAFWRINQTKIWRWNLALDNGIKEDCLCQFSSESVPQENLIEGVKRKVTINIYVVPIKRDPAFDRTIIDLWQSGLINNLSDIEKIPNVWLPDAVGV